MANTYFKFKQFTIQQEHCAMKVTTDACLFGAWAAEKQLGSAILDIGAGTGLISLMLAQKNIAASIDAIEIDEAAANQAKQNFTASSFGERLTVYPTAIQQFAATIKYNFIVSNPPFFEDDLQSSNNKRNIALHSTLLSLDQLIASIKNNISADGKFALLLPYHRTNYCIELATPFYLQEKITVKQTEKHTPFRSMLLFSTTPTTTLEKEIIIKENNIYTQEFINLLQAYYLYL